MRSVLRRSASFRSNALAGLLFACVLSVPPLGLAQMVSSGAKDQPARPLPPKPPPPPLKPPLPPSPPRAFAFEIVRSRIVTVTGAGLLVPG